MPVEHRFFNNPDVVANIENRKSSVSMELFQKILDDFTSSDFTLEDIINTYNSRSWRKKDKLAPGYEEKFILYGISHLQYLSEKGLLNYDKNTHTYSINHDSPEVANMVTNEEDENGLTIPDNDEDKQ